MNARIFLSPPWMGGGEQEQVREAFASNYVAPTGPMVDRFEALFSERVGIPNVCALSSGTAGLDLLFRELGVEPSVLFDDFVVELLFEIFELLFQFRVLERENLRRKDRCVL